MRTRTWILLVLTLGMSAAAVAIGVWPVQVTEEFFSEWGNGPNGPVTVSCGSPLFKESATLDVPYSYHPYEGRDLCLLTRDHRRGPMKILGGTALLLLLGTAYDAVANQRREDKITPIRS
jgi:hypothetical protein